MTDLIKTIEKLALDPTIDAEKMQKILDVQERILNKQAQSRFAQSLIGLQGELPIIKKSGKISINGQVRSTYAKYEDIDKLVRPLLAKWGFSLSFNAQYDKNAVVVGKLLHRDGHFEIAEIALPYDSSGSKNNVQAIGSTLSYAKRYLIGMLINIVTEDEDDDAQSFDYINEDQVLNIESLMSEINVDKAKFLIFMRANSVNQIKKRDYNKAIQILEKKRNQS